MREYHLALYDVSAGSDQKFSGDWVANKRMDERTINRKIVEKAKKKWLYFGDYNDGQKENG